jgi:uncharacterized protein
MPDYPIVDADGHVQEKNLPWADLLEPAYRDRAPKLVRDNRGVERLMVGGVLWGKPEGRGRNLAGAPHSRYPTKTTGMEDPVQRIKDMDLEGIDTAVLFGTSVFLSLPFFEDRELACDMARVYNNWVAEYCRTAPDRLKGIALLPLQDPGYAVQELRRCVNELGFVGMGTPAWDGSRNLEHPDFEPLWAEAERLDVPVCVHVGSGRPAAGADRYDNAYMVHVVTHAFEQMLGCLSMVGGGVLERHPGLRVAFLEAGAGWVPYWLERMEEHYEYLQPCLPWLSKSPAEYLRSEQCYYSFEPDEQSVNYVCDFVGDERILWASDYNHSDCKFPHTLEPVLERTDMSEERKRRLLSDNAQRLYGFTVPSKLAAAPA